MTPIFCCGFECGTSINSAHWFWVGTDISFSTSVKRSGARSMKINPIANTTGVTIQNSISTNILVGRFYIYFASFPPSGDLFLYLMSSTATDGGVYFQQSDSSIYARQNSVNGASGIAITTGVWYRIDFKHDVSSNPRLLDVQVDGVACGQSSRATAGTTVTDPRIAVTTGPLMSFDLHMDDVIFSSASGDYPIGDGQVDHFVPTADGTHNVAGANDFEIGTGGTDITNATTTAYQLVDDVPLQAGAPGTTDFINMAAPPNATDYVEVIFGPAPGISAPSVAPRAVQVIAGIAQAGTGTGNMELRMNDNGTLNTLYTATAVAGVTNIAFKTKHYATAIAGGGSWVIGGGGDGDFTDLRIRFGSPGAVDANPDQYFTSAMIEAEFAPVTPPTTFLKDIIGLGLVPRAR